MITFLAWQFGVFQFDTERSLAPVPAHTDAHTLSPVHKHAELLASCSLPYFCSHWGANKDKFISCKEQTACREKLKLEERCHNDGGHWKSTVRNIIRSEFPGSAVCSDKRLVLSQIKQPEVFFYVGIDMKSCQSKANVVLSHCLLKFEVNVIRWQLMSPTSTPPPEAITKQGYQMPLNVARCGASNFTIFPLQS